MTRSNESAVVLVGGRGSRLVTLAGGLPKPMVPIGGKPFLGYLIRQLEAAGVRRVVLATGYRSEAVEAFFADGASFGVSIAYSREIDPLGTGGAVRMASELIDAEQFLVLNGDSFFAINPSVLLDGIVPSGGAAISLAELPDTARYGLVDLNAAGRVISFIEKSSAAGRGLINAGVYAFTKSALSGLQLGRAYSLEHEVLPALASSGLLSGVRFDAYFIDIGTPESYLALAANPSRLVEWLES